TSSRAGTSHDAITRSSAAPIRSSPGLFLDRRRARTRGRVAPRTDRGGLDQARQLAPVSLSGRSDTSMIDLAVTNWSSRVSPVLKILGVEHVAIAVDDIDAALAKYREVFGIDAAEREYVESQKTETARLPLGASALELISPKGNESLVRFLERRGPGLHHIAI